MKNCMDELAGLESQYGGTRSTNQSTLLGKKRPEAGGGIKIGKQELWDKHTHTQQRESTVGVWSSIIYKNWRKSIL